MFAIAEMRICIAWSWIGQIVWITANIFVDYQILMLN